MYTITSEMEVDMANHGPTEIIHTASTGYGFGASSDEAKRYQTFIAPEHNGGLASVSVKLRKNSGTVVKGIDVDLYETDQRKPSGRPIAHGLIRENFDGSLKIVSTGLFSPSLVPGREYAVVLASADPDVRYEWPVTAVSDAVSFGRWDDRQRGWANESQLGNGWLRTSIVNGEVSVDLTHDGTRGYAFGHPVKEKARYQTFLAPDRQAMVGVDLKLRKAPGVNHTSVIVSLIRTDEHKPYGPPIASAVIPSFSIGESWAIVNAPLYYPALDAEGEYAIMLRQAVPNDSAYEWAVAPTNQVASFGRLDDTAWFDDSPLGDGWMKVWLKPSAVDCIDLENDADQSLGFGSEGDELARYQSFTLASPSTVTVVDVFLRSTVDVCPSDVICTIAEMTDDLFRRPPLAMAEVGAYAVRDEWSIVHIPIKTTTLARGTYAVVLTQAVPETAHYEWGVSTGGNEHFGRSDGTTLTDESNRGNGWMRVWVEPPDVEVDFSHDGLSPYGFGNIDGEKKRYQTFVAPDRSARQAFELNGVQLQVRRFPDGGNDQSDLLVELYDTEDDHPTGEPKATAFVPSASIGSWVTLAVPLFHRFDWDKGCIQPGHTYAIVLSQRVESKSHYEWKTGRVANPENFGKWDGSKWLNEWPLGTGWLKVSLREHPVFT